MYKISVPIINTLTDRMGREALLKQIKELNGERVFLAAGAYSLDENVRKTNVRLFKENAEFFRANGLEVGAWLWTFMVEDKNDFTKIRSCDKGDSATECCPSDEKFRHFAVDYIAEIAAAGVDIIMFDDDFRYGYFDCGLGCVCENHIEYMENILGESLKGKDLQKLLLSGGKSRYRDAWIKANGHFFKVFAKAVEKGVHKIAPNVRIGLCSCITGWDIDGIDTPTISKILAGNTKPFMRLIGAPYWAVNKNWGNRLQNVIENERMELSFAGNSDIEIFAEGDAWPRPRYNCPASYLEIFDMALRADGRINGILKYGVDYFALPEYENGYVERHKRDLPLFEAIENAFSDKTAVGVRVYERQRKFCDMLIPERMAGSSDVEDCFFSPASKMMADNTIPTVYDGFGACGIAFAENVLDVPEEALYRGIILDIRAAEILQSQGIDVGLDCILGEEYATREYLTGEILDIASGEDKQAWLKTMVKAAEAGATDGKYMFAVSGLVKKIRVNQKAKIISKFRLTNNGEVTFTDIPASYLYENTQGMKFAVFAFEGYFNDDRLLRGYWRGRTVERIAKNYFGTPLPAYSCGNPDLYMLAKSNDSALSVGLWNIFADTAFSPKVLLGENYSTIEFINCNGTLKGNEVVLSDIAPFGFAAFTVKK